MTHTRSSGRRPAALVAPLLLGLALAVSGCGTLGIGKAKPKTPTTGNRVPILSRIESGAKVDETLAGTGIVLPPETANPEWPQAGNTPNKAYGALALGATPTRIWTASIAGTTKQQRLAAAPVIGDGKLFVIDTDGVVHCFDAATGAQRWTTSFVVKGKPDFVTPPPAATDDDDDAPAATATTAADADAKPKKKDKPPKFRGDNGARSLFGGGVSYDGGHVYVTTGLGDVAALDANTGNRLWTVRPAGPLRGSPTIAFNALYVMTQDNQIFALNTDDGKVLWNESGSTTQAGVFGVAAPAAGQGTVIAGYSSGEVVAYRYENGRQLWSDALARTSISTQVGSLTDVDADPIIDRGQVFALGQGGRMASYDLLTGQRIWELNLAGISTPAVAGDWVFTLTDEGKLMAIARGTGKVRWLTELGRWKHPKKRKGDIFWTGPVLAGDRLWVASSEGEVKTASVLDGSVTPFTKLGKPVSLEPVVAGGVLYVLDDGGHITAFR